MPSLSSGKAIAVDEDNKTTCWHSYKRLAEVGVLTKANRVLIYDSLSAVQGKGHEIWRPFIRNSFLSWSEQVVHLVRRKADSRDLPVLSQRQQGTGISSTICTPMCLPE